MANKILCEDFKLVDNDLYWDEIRGDFVFSVSDSQHILDILESYPGWWKSAPHIGAGVPQLLKAKVNQAVVESVIKTQLEGDMYQVLRPQIKVDANGKFLIQPNAFRL